APPGACVPQHRVGLPHSGGTPEVDAQLAPASRRRHRVMCRSLSDPVRAVVMDGLGAAGHRWIHPDRGVTVRPRATAAAATATGGLDQAGSLSGQARLARCQPRRHPPETTHASGLQRTPGPGPSTKLLFCTPTTRAMLSSQNLAATRLRSALA